MISKTNSRDSFMRPKVVYICHFSFLLHLQYLLYIVCKKSKQLHPQTFKNFILYLQSIILIPDSAIPELAHTGPRISVPQKPETAHSMFCTVWFSDTPDFLYTGLEILVPTPVRYKSNWLNYRRSPTADPVPQQPPNDGHGVGAQQTVSDYSKITTLDNEY